MTKTLTLLFAAAFASVALADDTAEEMLAKAMDKETTDRDPKAALTLYLKVIERHRAEEEIAAKAQYRIGECCEKLGMKDEAIAAYDAVLHDYPQQNVIVEKARERISELSGKGASNEEEQKVERALESIKISLNFTETPAAEVTSFIREVSQLNLVVDERVEGLKDKPLTMRVEELALSDALKLICQLLDCEQVNRNGVLVWTSHNLAKTLAARPMLALPADAGNEVQAIYNKLQGTKIDLDFTDSTVYDIIDFLQEFAKINIVVEDRNIEKKLTIAIRDARLSTVVDILSYEAGMTPRFENGVLYFGKEK